MLFGIAALGIADSGHGETRMVDAGCIFLNYRRQQSEWPTLRLRDRLVEVFGSGRIFTDVDSIEPGQDFTKALEAAVGSCRVLLAVIGQDWVNASDDTGRRRLENPGDWVRIEIESALRRPKVLVIPVLIDGATMPRVEQLPGELAQLSLRQAVEITASGFVSQVETLIVTLQKILEHPSVQAPSPRVPARPTPMPTGPMPIPTGPMPVRPAAPPPIAFTNYPVLPEDLLWSGPVTGNVAVERVLVGAGTWVKIGDAVVVLRGEGGPVTLRSSYIGQVEALYYQNGQPLVQGLPLFALAVSGWLFRVNFRMPFDTGVLFSSGMPAKKFDADGTASRLMVTVDNEGRRPVPWGSTSLLYVPAGRHVFSASYEQPGSSFKTVSEVVKIRSGKRIAMSYEAPRAAGRSGKLRC
jgi:TIR domain